MATATRRSRFVPDSVVVLTVIAGLVVGLAALCCCFGEHTLTHGPGRIAAASVVVAPDTVSDVAMAGDPPDQDADGGGGCGHPGDHLAAVVTSGGAVARELAAVPVAEVRRPDLLGARPAVAVSGTAARAPASHLLCIMRT